MGGNRKVLELDRDVFLILNSILCRGKEIDVRISGLEGYVYFIF